MKTLIIMIYLLGLKAGAAEHREHQAHQHGAAKIEMAFQGPAGLMTLEVPSEALYGFEYAPTKSADKKKQTDALAALESQIASMVQFDAALKCVISKEKIEVDQHEGGKHSDVDASFKVVCEKSPKDSTITFNIQKTFPGMKSVSVEAIADDVQKSLKADKDGSKLALKKQ